ncbi:hypothetical protein FOZ63_016095, partial [Perkinsus olseni]
TVGLFDLDVADFKLFQSKLILLLDSFRSKAWMNRYGELEKEEAGSGDRVVQHTVYAHIAEELFRAGYINIKDPSKLPVHLDAVCNFLYESATYVSKGSTLVSMAKRDSLVISVETAFNNEMNARVRSAVTKKEPADASLTTSSSNDALSLKDFRDESEIAESLREITPFKGERDSRSATRWRQQVEDECDHLASPIVTFYYAKRCCDPDVWKKLWFEDTRSITRSYPAYSKAVSVVWDRAGRFDSQATKELLLIDWVNLKQRRNESSAGFASRLTSLRNER